MKRRFITGAFLYECFLYLFSSCHRAFSTTPASSEMLSESASSLPSIRTRRYMQIAMGKPTLATACRIVSRGITPFPSISGRPPPATAIPLWRVPVLTSSFGWLPCSPLLSTPGGPHPDLFCKNTAAPLPYSLPRPGFTPAALCQAALLGRRVVQVVGGGVEML